MCCNVVQYVAVCYSVLQCVIRRTMYHSTWQCLLVCCSVENLQHKSACILGISQEVNTKGLKCVAACCSVLQRVAACCSVLQRVAACCSVLQCVVVLNIKGCSKVQVWIQFLQVNPARSPQSLSFLKFSLLLIFLFMYVFVCPFCVSCVSLVYFVCQLCVYCVSFVSP